MSMDRILYQTLRIWRDSIVDKTGFPQYRVLGNSTLEEIATIKPKTREELMSIKGIKDAKCALYGTEIIRIVNGSDISEGETSEIHAVRNSGLAYIFDPTSSDPEPLSVSDYLEVINRNLLKVDERVLGEITSAKQQGSAVYFSLRDNGGSTLSCFMWLRDLQLYGVSLVEGMEVIVSGVPELYKPTGRFSLRVRTVSLVGDGALKVAYEKLRKKLESEGLFAESRKKSIPDFPKNIGIITSRSGAVIHDVLSNLGHFGYRILFTDSRVEGVTAVKDILRALRTFRKKAKMLDVVILIRGGGSLESLQAFNNEEVIREIASYPVPIICAIGHDKDVPLATLVSDASPSTPTAVTALLNRSWEHAIVQIQSHERLLVSRFESVLHLCRLAIFRGEQSIHKLFEGIESSVSNQEASLKSAILQVESGFKHAHLTLEHTRERIFSLFGREISLFDQNLTHLERTLVASDPRRLLRLGYAISLWQKKVVRSVHDVPTGAELEIMLSDGTLHGTIQGMIADDPMQS